MGITWNMRLREIIEDNLCKGLKPKDIAEKYGVDVNIIYKYIRKYDFSHMYKYADIKNRKSGIGTMPLKKQETIQCHQCGFGNLENKTCEKCWYFKIYNGFKL